MPGHTATTIALQDRAVSTSGGYGLSFDQFGRFNYLFRLQDGTCSHGVLSISVVADLATLADALSTAFCVMAFSQAQSSAARPGTTTYFTLLDGLRISCGS